MKFIFRRNWASAHVCNRDSNRHGAYQGWHDLDPKCKRNTLMLINGLQVKVWDSISRAVVYKTTTLSFLSTPLDISWLFSRVLGEADRREGRQATILITRQHCKSLCEKLNWILVWGLFDPLIEHSLLSWASHEQQAPHFRVANELLGQHLLGGNHQDSLLALKTQVLRPVHLASRKFHGFIPLFLLLEIVILMF